MFWCFVINLTTKIWNRTYKYSVIFVSCLNKNKTLVQDKYVLLWDKLNLSLLFWWIKSYKNKKNIFYSFWWEWQEKYKNKFIELTCSQHRLKQYWSRISLYQRLLVVRLLSSKLTFPLRTASMTNSELKTLQILVLRRSPSLWRSPWQLIIM